MKLSLAYAVGNPGKLKEETEKRDPLVFIGIPPWEIRTRMDDQTDRMIAQKEEKERLALEAKIIPATAEVVEVKKPEVDDSAVVESLELVEPSPEDFNPRRRSR